MAAYGEQSKLPREVRVIGSAVPGAGSAGIVTSFDTDLSYAAFTNTTGNAITVKLMNGASAAVGNYSAYSVPAGTTPAVVQFDPPLRFKDGLRWVAQSDGLNADALGWTKANFST